MSTALDVANRFYELTDRHDADGLATLLADDMTFVGPVMAATGAAEYVAMNRKLLPFHAATRMRHQFVDGGEVCSVYEMDLDTPAGDTLTVEIADVISVADGRIRAQRLYYDPRGFADAFGM